MLNLAPLLQLIASSNIKTVNVLPSNIPILILSRDGCGQNEPKREQHNLAMKELVGARREINDACVDENISVIIDSLAVIDAFRVCCGGIFPYDQDGKFRTSSFQFKRTQNLFGKPLDKPNWTFETKWQAELSSELKRCALWLTFQLVIFSMEQPKQSYLSHINE